MPQKKHSIPNSELRQSQLLSTFGPGAMVDLPDKSVIISGLSFWQGDKAYIREERLRNKVRDLLGIDDIRFYSPPQKNNDPSASKSGIKAFVFPQWFLANVNKTYRLGNQEYRTRPLVKASQVNTRGKVKFDDENVSAVPIRFVQACVNGHISDIEWYGFAHNDFNTTCRRQLWLDEAGSGNDFEQIFIRCECGKRRALSTAKVQNSKVLGICQGHRPWLGDKGREFPCHSYRIEDGKMIETDKPEYNRLLIRSASNAYFSQLLSVISLPDPDSALKKVLDKFYHDDLEYEEDINDLKKNLRKPRYSELEKFSLDKIWAEIQLRKAGHKSEPKTIKQVELEVLLTCNENRQPSNQEKDFDAEAILMKDKNFPFYPFIDRTVLVHRLREVIALIGFTRFEAAMPNTEGELDDLAINVRRASLDFEDKEKPWLPAIENKGEGVFINFRKEQINAWMQREGVKKRGQQLLDGFHLWLDSRNIPSEKGKFPSLPYIMLHSLSHLLITAVSLECGYAPSAIKERIYANDTGYGILLHTGTSGSEGTLGGLVQVGRRIEHHLAKALEIGRLCSNDPVCSSHIPTELNEARFLHGAACHGCLLIAETSCERRNEFLDRALVVGTVDQLGAEFFPDDLF